MKTKNKKVENKYQVDELKFLAVPIRGNKMQIHVYTYSFPKLITRIINVLTEEKDKKKDEYYLRLSELNAFLEGCFSDIIHMNPIRECETNLPWIISKERVPQGEIAQLLKYWVEIYYPQNRVDLSTMDFQEKSVNVSFVFDTEQNRTGRVSISPNIGKPYTIFRRYLLHTLNQMTFSIEGKEKNMYGMLTRFLDRNDKDKLISWKPHGGNGKWSYAVELSLQSIPFDSTMYLYIHPSVFKCTQSTYLRDSKSKVSVVYQLPKDYIVGDSSPSLVNFGLKLGSNHAMWPRFTTEMLKKLGSEKLLPPMEDFKKNPIEFLNQDDYLNIAIPHGSHFKNQHPIKSGLGYQERLQLANRIKDQLQLIWSGFETEFPCLEKPKYTRTGTSEFKTYFFSDVIQIIYADPVWKEELIRSLKKKLNLEKTDEDDVYIVARQSEKTIHIQSISAFALFGENPYQIDIKDKKVNEARKQYANHISECIKESDNNFTFAFIELPGRESFDEGKDPKDILRNVFAKKGILTQFIMPMELKNASRNAKKKNDPEDQTAKIKHRCDSAVKDMLRQYGNVKRTYFNKSRISTALIGIHIVKYGGKCIPILVSLLKNEIYATVPTIREEWVPYRSIAQLLAKHAASVISVGKDKVSTIVYKALEQFRLFNNVDHTVLFAVAANIRSFVSWMQNTKISKGEIKLGEDHYLPLGRYSLVRIRQEDSNETPEWTGRGFYLQDEQSPVQDVPEALHVALVQWNENVFFSIARKPNSYQESPGTKLENEGTSYRRETAVELTIPVYNQEYTDPYQLAHLAHGLRTISIQTDDYLENPLPIHLAKLLDEYVFLK